MATKTFTKEFNLSSKGAEHFIEALNKSKRVDLKNNHDVKTIHDKNEIDDLVTKMLVKK